MRWTDSLKETTVLSLQELSRAVEKRRSLIHRVTISQRQPEKHKMTATNDSFYLKSWLAISNHFNNI